ncbi:hypothetical protein ElyMa_000786500, partial [Elysia marginata]
MSAACPRVPIGLSPGSPPQCQVDCPSGQSARARMIPCCPHEHATDAGESSTPMETASSRALHLGLAVAKVSTT